MAAAATEAAETAKSADIPQPSANGAGPATSGRTGLGRTWETGHVWSSEPGVDRRERESTDYRVKQTLATGEVGLCTSTGRCSGGAGLKKRQYWLLTAVTGCLQ